MSQIGTNTIIMSIKKWIRKSGTLKIRQWHKNKCYILRKIGWIIMTIRNGRKTFLLVKIDCCKKEKTCCKRKTNKTSLVFMKNNSKKNMKKYWNKKESMKDRFMSIISKMRILWAYWKIKEISKITTSTLMVNSNTKGSNIRFLAQWQVMKRKWTKKISTISNRTSLTCKPWSQASTT